MRTDHLNQKFRSFLSQFEFKSAYEDRLRKLIIDEFRKKMADNAEENAKLKKNLSESKNKIEKIKEKYATDEIFKEIYDKFSKKYKQNIQEIQEVLSRESLRVRTLKKLWQRVLKLLRT